MEIVHGVVHVYFYACELHNRAGIHLQAYSLFIHRLEVGEGAVVYATPNFSFPRVEPEVLYNTICRSLYFTCFPVVLPMENEQPRTLIDSD